MKKEPIKFPECMKDFISFYDPKLKELRLQIAKEFENWLGSEVDTTNQMPNDLDQKQEDAENNFLKRVELLEEQCLKDYVDLQLDLFNNNQITKEELVFRTSWINK